MYLLYLDWNAMKALRDAPDGDAAFRTAFAKYRHRFWLPYSSTHLDDLARGYDPADVRKVEFTYNDLAFIRYLTDGLCFQVYHGQEDALADRRDPITYFESHYEAQQDLKQNLFSIFTTPEDTSSDVLGALMKQMLNMPVIPFPEQGQGTHVADMFPGWSTKGTLGAVIEDMNNMTQRANTDYTYSTEMRDVIRGGLPMLDPRVVSSPDVYDPFARIDELLKPHMSGRSFFEMTEATLANPTDRTRPPSPMQRFIHAYYLLELLGYHAEKLKPKNHFPNIMGDATHAFLAGHCDFLVTDDKDLRYKAKAVYQKMRTSTTVLSIAEFTTLLEQGLAEYTPETSITYINAAIREGRLVTAPEDLPPSYILPYFLFDYFNAFEQLQNQLRFIRIETTYRTFTPQGVIRQVVEFLSSSLGPDTSGKSTFDAMAEMDEIAVDAWGGRQWELPNCDLLLAVSEGKLALTLHFIEAQPEPPTSVA